MRVLRREEIGGIMLIMGLIYAIGFTFGSSNGLRTSNGYIETFRKNQYAYNEQKAQEYEESLNGMTTVCNAMLEVSEKVCLEHINIAFSTGYIEGLSDAEEDTEEDVSNNVGKDI